MNPLPAPLVPAEVDLNGYEFMPFMGERLRRSSFNTRASDAEFRAAINLWWSSWWEIPAASLPNNERDLCRLAGLDSTRRWRKVRERVMEKWVLCADDRWYHPLLADLACDAYAKRRSQSTKGRIGANKRWGIKEGADAPANATAINANGSGNATATKSDSPGNGTGNSKLSEVEVKNPLTPLSTPRSKPSAASRSYDETLRRLEQQRAEHYRAQLPPGLTKPSDLLKASSPHRNPFDDDEEPQQPHPPAEPHAAAGGNA